MSGRTVHLKNRSRYFFLMLCALIPDRTKKNVSKALYVALAINREGRKEVLGLRLADTESAKFWMSVLTGIKNRGTDDMLIACTDGLTGFPDAVRSVFPDTHIRHCIVHMIRNSAKFVSYKELKAVCKDLKEVYSEFCILQEVEVLQLYELLLQPLLPQTESY